MKLLALFVGGLTVSSAFAAPAGDAPTPSIKKKRASKFQFVGVNESGAEFGNKNLPGQLGKDYTWPVHSTIDVGEPDPGDPFSWATERLTVSKTMMSKGFNIFRIPIMM
jgi:endoglucanase